MTSYLSDLIQYRRLFQMMLVLGIGGTLLPGFHISVINYPSMHIKRFINKTWLERYGSPLHQETITLLWSLIVSIYFVGGLLGCLCSGYLFVKHGKKKCLLCNNMLIMVAALHMGFSKTAKSFEMILIGRFLYGISAGVCSNAHSQYLGEISPKKLRGFANTSAVVFLTLGKVLGQIMGLREFLGTESLWPLLLAVCGIAAFVQLVSLPFFPESPPYLLIQKEDSEGCLKAMKQLWGEGDHQAEFDDMMKEKAAMKSVKTMSVLEVMKEPALRWQLCIMNLLMMSIQLCGLHASSIIDRFGRRMLLWGGYGLMAGILAILVTVLSLQNQFSWMAYCSVVLIFLFVITYGIGPSGAVISVMMEIFNQSARSSAFVIAGTTGWMSFIVIGMIFPFIVEALGPFCFLIFMGILVISGIFFYLFLPETKGKSIMEIKEEFSTIHFRKKLLPTAEKNSPLEHTFCTKF
ncbi:solute carrier family 2, facilitated glucose transporter member 11-like isoform X3 [Mauremys mutica]|uniref:solute carrier family 2, facilitated glucose transporter member 11-like isoform X3 n=1 Tax=Mauremys mutica TaxID=74926 RepID=UPI001D16755F|nr:solute carrier family 2, facilitated glucose transporter member 11-like isoform X3 [Mauremys mutica]